jgi:hypothetical protein
MTEKNFDDTFLSRLALTLRALEQEELEASDPHPLEPEDYEAIYTAYKESGGDPAAAKKQIAIVREKRDQALSRILQFVSDQYGLGPVERLDDKKLEAVARDAFHATEFWTEEVEMHNVAATRGSPLQVLLRTHYQLNESMLDMHDEILWPLAKRISPGE